MTDQPPPLPKAVERDAPTASTTVGTRRWPLFAAVAFALLLSGGHLIIGASPPDANATGAQVVGYFRDHSSAIRVSVWLTTLALLPFALLAGWLGRQVSGIARNVFLLGAAAYVVELTVWQWVSAGLALHPDQLDPRTARTLVDVTAYVGPMLTAAVILLAAPLGWAALRHENAAPAWFRWLTVVVVVEQAVETITVLGTSGFTAPGGSMNFPLGAVLFVVWVIACGAAFPADSIAPAVAGEDRALQLRPSAGRATPR